MFKIIKEEAPNYIIKLIPKRKQTIRTRNNHIPGYSCRTDFFKYYFFLSSLNDWLNLDDDRRNSESISIFKSKLLSFIRPVKSNIFNPKPLRLLSCLRLGLSHLNDHRFRHNLRDCMN